MHQHRHNPRLLALLGAVLLSTLLSACAGDVFPPGEGHNNQHQIAYTTGTVRYTYIEGGCWLIAADDGMGYQPINIPPAFLEDGLRVGFNGRLRYDLAGFCPGMFLELNQIKRL